MGVNGSITEEILGQMLLKSSDSWTRIQEIARRITTVMQLRWREDEAALNALANSTSAEAAVNAEQMQDDLAAAQQAVCNRQARARRAQVRAELLGDVELASAFRQLYGPAASDATSSIPAAVPLLLEATATVDPTPVAAAVAVAEAATATSPAAAAAPRVAAEVAPSPATGEMAPPSSPILSPSRRRQAQRQARAHMPPGRQQTGRAVPSAEELECRHQRQRELERTRLQRHRRARDSQAVTIPFSPLPSDEIQKRRSTLTVEEEAAISMQATSGR
ncbi:uncharacterized protein LOC121597189 [Anopheles merus]|uniref:uncharacterized protein LOC121597189 n=1 Tax=Anopheles merus TaxID=30066 RepID=UPI001BE4C339|nr:uncharacterized protein LOC121597189 [Anopheles merus]